MPPLKLNLLLLDRSQRSTFERKVLVTTIAFNMDERVKYCTWISQQCLKIAQKVAFNIANDASHVYILSGQKFIKNTKNWSILASF